MRPQTKEKTLPVLEKELDEVFAKFIKMRDIPSGIGKCFVCGTKLLRSQAHCGHYLRRALMPTRYDEMNCHAICETCNVFDAEHEEKYALKMVLEYGYPQVIQLEQRARSLQKFHRWEIADMIEHYKSELRLAK
jgi:hypothetical protein